MPGKQDTVLKRLTRVQDGHVLQQDMDLGGLSTGEQRRVALALTMGYLRLLQARGRCSSNIIILDEVHTNVDGSGIERIVSLMRKLPYESVFMIGQANTDLIDLADHHLEVVKRPNGACTVQRLF
jgi:energy-coupling factor transporter ATP-binding protein EcfA2